MPGSTPVRAFRWRFVARLAGAALAGTCACHATPPVAEPPPKLPATVDLRPHLTALGLGPRSQGPRGTCSIFTTCSAVEFGLARVRGKPERLSVEFVNWAAGEAAGRPSDGNFFHNALAGFERCGVCSETAMPYGASFDPRRVPSPSARAEALANRALARQGLVVRWIVPWVPDRFGVDERRFEEIRSVLARGYPVAAGSGHSRLLVGYRDDASVAGGGIFWTLDSGLGSYAEVSYEFVRTAVADVFWIEAPGTAPPADWPKSP